MDWSSISTDITDDLHGVALLVGGLGGVFALFAFLNWTVGGIALLGRRRLVLRRSWPFVTMRWLGLSIWLATLPSAAPHEIDDLRQPVQLFFTLANLGGTIVMLLGTARAPLPRKSPETPSSVKPLFEKPS